MQTTTIYRSDYQPYPFELKTVNLHFTLDPQTTLVQSTLQFCSKNAQPHDLVLNADEITLLEVKLNGQVLTPDQYQLTDTTLTIPALSGSFELCIKNECHPDKNTTLMGLYVSSHHLFTQCETEGFRRITFFPDRPDVMSIFTVTLVGSQKDYPYLLSNGNLLESKPLENGLHQATWHDPFAKPCYLFALVAGDFDVREKTTTTRSGKEVLLQLYSDKGNGDQTLWALTSLENALKWDESRFSLELDLDRFMVVAAQDFNMGAMENKGLNIFNATYVLADPQTATDKNYAGIESVIGHEYFHNWTGNRVTCRDWFQLSLKEGLTVFRDQEFSADMMSKGLDPKAAHSARTVKRIEDVTVLRAAQFAEDAGPMAHPIRPNSYQEIGNFYTATVYEKGAEVIRMQHTLLGEEGFMAGMKEYFRRHDGQAVTCDDFVNAMQWAYQQQHPTKDLNVFRRWYSQAGTPTVQVEDHYDVATHTYRLRLTQSCPKVGVEKLDENLVKQPLHIPFKLGLLDEQGQVLPFTLEGQTQDEVLLELLQESQAWTFTQVTSQPIPSLLRDFSAPVIVRYPYTTAQLAMLAKKDSNPFARWEAVQAFASQEILRLVADETATVNPELIELWASNLNDPDLDAAYRTELLRLPRAAILLEQMNPMNPATLDKVMERVYNTLANEHAQTWQSVYKRLDAEQAVKPYSTDTVSAGQRSLKNLALSMWVRTGAPDSFEAALMQYAEASNMTDRLACLSILLHFAPAQLSETPLADFYDRFQDNPLVIDMWFALQANARSSTVDTVKALMQHPSFTLRTPNRARSLIFQFCINNMAHFHTPEGYDFWADQVLNLNKINPEVASRLARRMDNWARFAEPLRTSMKAALEKVNQAPDLSRNVKEIVSKALSIS